MKGTTMQEFYHIYWKCDKCGAKHIYHWERDEGDFYVRGDIIHMECDLCGGETKSKIVKANHAKREIKLKKAGKNDW